MSEQNAESAAAVGGDTGFHLYRKYDVRKLNDPTGEHDECSFFVLDLTHDPHAAAAMLAYVAAKQGADAAARNDRPGEAKPLQEGEAMADSQNEIAMDRGAAFDWHDDGVLWLVNRVVFHPRGFALSRSPGADPEWTIQGDGTEPWAFTAGADDECYASVQALFARLRPARSDESGGDQ